MSAGGNLWAELCVCEIAGLSDAAQGQTYICLARELDFKSFSGACVFKRAFWKIGKSERLVEGVHRK